MKSLCSSELMNPRPYILTPFIQCVITHIRPSLSDTPERPRDVTAVFVTTTGVVLEWVEPHDNNAPIVGYRVSYTRPPFLDGLEVTVNSSVERVNITGLHPGFPYTFSVVAFNEIGDSPPSDDLMVTTNETGVYTTARV